VVFLPQILILFFFLGLLEDCGYLARAAYLMDRHMARLGLSGKSFIPLLSSFACAIPGVMAARVIEDRRDRLTTILVAPLMSCSARLPVYALLTAAFVPATPVLGRLLDMRGVAFFAMYLLGIVTAAAVALLLKRTVLRGAAAPFVLELPTYKVPSLRLVLFRMVERAWVFLKGAGTLILAVSILMWAALYFPRLDASAAASLLAEKARLEAALEAAPEGEREALGGELETVEAQLGGMQLRQSVLGRMGRWIEPVVRPLGWDWRIGSAAIASFPAREVVVASLGVIFEVGGDLEEDAGQGRLRDALRSATWHETGRPLFTTATALSLMVFFALCAQCVSTLAVMRRETNSWRWPAFCFAYMTGLAYAAALVTYQVATRLGG
jgi:ferrous iron transport protein B